MEIELICLECGAMETIETDKPGPYVCSMCGGVNTMAEPRDSDYGVD